MTFHFGGRRQPTEPRQSELDVELYLQRSGTLVKVFLLEGAMVTLTVVFIFIITITIVTVISATIATAHTF